MGLINKELIQINAKYKDKNEVIDEIAVLLCKDKRTCNKKGLIRDILKREEEFSTSMGLGVAIPHAHSEYVSEPSVVFIKLPEAITWGTDDNVKTIFGILNPLNNNNNNYHLKILSKLARELMNDEFRDKLNSVEDKDEALKIMSFLNDRI